MTDITLENEPAVQAASFEDYVQGPLEPVWQAVAAVFDYPAFEFAPDFAEHAFDHALTNARLRWSDAQVYDAPDLWVFANAVAYQRTTKRDELTARACTVANVAFEASANDIATALDLTPESVASILDQAPIDTAQQIQHQPARPARVAGVVHRHRTRRRRRNLKLVGMAAALLLTLGLLAQLVARPDRVAVEPLVEPEAQPVSTPVASPTTLGAPAAGEIGQEPRPDLIPWPEHITTDGQGGFIGVRSPSPQNPQVVFTRSNDGETWSLASRWGLGAGATISRVERSGEYFMVWIDGTAQSSDSVIETVGISRDLIAWTVFELAVDDPDPIGLTYTSEVASVSVSGNNILTLVTTTVDIDFDELLLSQGYTCGETITETEVSVNLCNADLDVLSLSDVETLPERNRLFVSRDGTPFQQIELPFDSRTASHLTSVNGAFAVTDETSLRFAQSTDAREWQIITAGKPPFPVRAAETNQAGAVVGVGTEDGELVLFHHDGQARNTTSTPLEALVGPTSEDGQVSTTTSTPLETVAGPISQDVQAVVGAGPGGWAVHLMEPDIGSWLLTSPDGRDWSLVALGDPVGTEHRLLVGRDKVIAQWSGDDGNSGTTIVDFGP